MMAAVAHAGGLRVAGPLLEITPTGFQLGQVPQESSHTLIAELSNAGNADLRITKVEPDCGCTLAEVPDSTLTPGEKTRVKIVFSTRTFSGSVKKHVYLYTNDPTSPKMAIPIAAFVRPIVRYSPTEVDFGVVPRGETPQRMIVFRSAREDSLKLQDVMVPPRLLDYQVERGSEGDSTLYRLRLTLRKDAPVGEIHATVKASARTKSTLLVNLAIRGQVHGFFLAEPANLALGQLREGQIRQRSVRLEAARRGSHRVIDAACGNPNLQTHVTEVEPGRIYEVTVTVPETMAAGRIRDTLRIETDDPDQPEILIRVSGNVRRSRRG